MNVMNRYQDWLDQAERDLRRNDRACPIAGCLLLFYPYFDLPIGVDLLVYTEEQLARRLQAADAFMTRIWEESRALPVSLE